MSAAPERPLAVHRNPIRTFFSRGPWIATVYLVSYLPVGTVLFCATAAAWAITLGLAITWLSVPLVIGAATIARGGAEIERRRSRPVIGPVTATYEPVTSSGVLTRAGVRWRDPTTRRDLAYLLVLFLPLVALDAATLAIWLGLLAGLSIPLWYWSVVSHRPNGQTAHGILLNYLPHPASPGIWIGDPGTALLVAAVFFVLCLAGSYLVVGTARLHGAVARLLLGPRIDPLAEAKAVLAAPGPLAP